METSVVVTKRIDNSELRAFLFLLTKTRVPFTCVDKRALEFVEALYELSNKGGVLQVPPPPNGNGDHEPLHPTEERE